MIPKNVDHLSEQAKYTGFGDGLHSLITDKIKETEARAIEFPAGESDNKQVTWSLNLPSKEDDDTVNSTLNYSKSKASDMHFWNDFTITVTNPNEGKLLRQNFKIDNTYYPQKDGKTFKPNITYKEAYNLISERAVKKDIALTPGKRDSEFKESWLMLEGGKTVEFPDYNLDASLHKYQIVDLETESFAKNLVRSVERGNLQLATFREKDDLGNDVEMKRLISASPDIDDLKIYDTDGNRLSNKIMLETQQGKPISEEKAMNENIANNQQQGENSQGTGQGNNPDQNPGEQKSGEDNNVVNNQQQSENSQVIGQENRPDQNLAGQIPGEENNVVNTQQQGESSQVNGQNNNPDQNLPGQKQGEDNNLTNTQQQGESSQSTGQDKKPDQKLSGKKPGEDNKVNTGSSKKKGKGARM